ncbi:hypothetical protein DYY88_04035 [Leptolyngbya iicbica LK]|uniref:Uncharacterized protein n=3 Tax=Cyanophyceae TaxID=3028117 RepID=A0A4Q7EGJ7_9CYAN|nr:hypothetical protein DYY88_04035 [Leptolyngbya sp. LK]
MMLRVQPEYQFSEGVYAASAPYGQDILQQAIANKINAFVENPTTDLHLRVSNRLFKYVVGLTLIVTVGIFPAFLLSARQPGRRGASVRLPMVMVSLSLFLGGLLVVIAINHRIELRCANQQCVLLAWRLQDQGTLVMTAEALRAARIRQETYTNDEGDTQILHQVVLATDQGDFSLLANARAMPAIALAEEVNRFINHPATNQVNFRTDNWLLTAALGGVCGLLSGITLWWAFRS